MSRSLCLSTVLIEEYEALRRDEDPPALDLAARRAALEAELEALPEELRPKQREIDRRVEEKMVEEVYAFLHRSGRNRAALCLSGGGIRSATFGLGLIQGLAKIGLLGRFDFLSTVSGGGYVGSWLSAWLHHTRNPKHPGHAESADEALARVQASLSSAPLSPLDPEPEPLRHLRGHSRFMSPKLGLFSVDTWTLAATYLRNLLLNWMVFLPLIAVFLMLPRLSIFLIQLPQYPFFAAHVEIIQAFVYSLALVAGWAGIGYIAPCRPSLARESKIGLPAKGVKGYLLRCHLPLMLMAIAITTNWAWSVIHFGHGPEWWVLTALGVLLHVGGLLCSWLWTAPRFKLDEIAAVVVSGGVGGFLLWWGATWLFSDLSSPREKMIYVCFATPLLLFLYLLATFIFVGISRAYTSDADREWMARSAGWLLVTVVLRAGLAAVVFLGPIYFLDLMRSEILSVFTSLVGGVSGILTLILGVSAKTGLLGLPVSKDMEKPTRSLQDFVLALAAPIFIVFLLVILSLVTTFLVVKVARLFGSGLDGASYAWRADSANLYAILVDSPFWAVLAVGLTLLLIGRLMGGLININHFSLHSTYRDRLIRAYLGASRGKHRKPHPFIDFDEKDNIPMHRLADNRPLHLINMALNQVSSDSSVGQDRKACSFTVTPLHAGHYRLGYRPAKNYGGCDGISLGTALAISGAAASPNMGYHSSAVITFLMAMFNLRLGWWLGNPGPAGDKSYREPSPQNAAACLLSEAFGLTDDQSDYVYLSDGGHFENLGLYEMVLRRCSYVVVSDAGHDPDFGFDDLGRAITQIRVDLGIPITFEEIALRPRRLAAEFSAAAAAGGVRKEEPAYCALGRIHYSTVDGTPPADDGYLLYVKPCLNGTEPVNVYQYAHENPLFPHEPTADQFYSETQFESYRSLGEHMAGRIFAKLAASPTAAATFENLFENDGASFRRQARPSARRSAAPGRPADDGKSGKSGGRAGNRKSFLHRAAR
jgi:hypothetical protein